MMLERGNGIFLVWHEHELPNGDESEKLIGVYTSEEEAHLAVARLKKQPGFSEYPDGFAVEPSMIGKDHWSEGFFTWTVPSLSPDQVLDEHRNRALNLSISRIDNDKEPSMLLRGDRGAFHFLANLLMAVYHYEGDVRIALPPSGSGPLLKQASEYGLLLERVDAKE